MSALTLRRTYAFSDTYGRSKNPFLQDDADALISTDFRSFPLEMIKREFDIYGRESVTGHMLRLIFQLHEETLQAPYFPKNVQEELRNTITGVFINAAPRTTHENGAPFYVATAGNIRIVTTDIAGLATVKDKIETLAHLRNDKNVVYSPTEQFRSSYAAFMLHPDHGIELQEDSLDVIPDYPEDKWELSYVDRFGNIVTYTKNPEARWNEVMKARDPQKSTVTLLIGNVSQEVFIGSSLRDADPGSLVVYMNKNIDVLRKWLPNEDSYTRLRKSAFFQFAKPEIGARLRAL